MLIFAIIRDQVLNSYMRTLKCLGSANSHPEEILFLRIPSSVSGHL